MFRVHQIIWILSITAELLPTELSSTSFIIVHRQYYEDHIVFIHFMNVRRSDGANEELIAEFRCTSDFEIQPQCVSQWQAIPLCHVNKTRKDVYYNCLILHDWVLLSFPYELKAGVKSSTLGWINKTVEFKAEMPRISEPLQDLAAMAVDPTTVRLSWKRVSLMEDIRHFETENVRMLLRIAMSSANFSSSKNLSLSPVATSTTLGGFQPDRNYSLTASYHFFVSSLVLPRSKVAGPVNVAMPKPVVASDPVVNQSCQMFLNGSINYLNITWTIPPTDRNVGEHLVARLKLDMSEKQFFYNVIHRLGSFNSFIFNDTFNSDVLVEIDICNPAGCSEITKFPCLSQIILFERSNKDSREWQYITGLLVSIGALIVIIALSLLFNYKKRMKKRKDNDAMRNKVISPRSQDHYNEAILVIRTGYDDFPINEVTSTAEGSFAPT